jgi:predicted enzyme related to lactoylglutathione lyase
VGNPVVAWQIVATDPDAVAAFYRDLFGWTLAVDNALRYRELRSGGGTGIDGGVWPAPPGAPTFVQLLVEVEDIDAMVARAEAQGARVVVPKSVLPDGDAMAVLVDPAGLAFGLRTAAPRG